MKQTFEFTKIDEAGRVLIKKNIRKMLDIKPGDSFQVFIDKGNLVLSPAKPCCCICSGRKNLVLIGEKYICQSCKKQITEN